MFRRRLLLAVALATTPASSALAQRAAPAAVTNARVRDLQLARPVTDSSHSLGYDMKRGATYGAITGAVLAGITAVLISHSGAGCCEQPSKHVTLATSVGIVAAGSALGACVGAVLGYSYHFNRDPAK
jgi:hypothetical protein